MISKALDMMILLGIKLTTYADAAVALDYYLRVYSYHLIFSFIVHLIFHLVYLLLMRIMTHK